MTRSRCSRSGTDRGQTLPDFAVGISVFLVTVTFVSVFVPQMILPFDDQEQSVVAERITSSLGDDLLTERRTSSKLNESSTKAFFSRSEEEAIEQLGASPWHSLNVTLREAPSHGSDSAILCAVDDPNGEAWIGECEAGADRFALGQPAPQDDRSVATGRRALSTNDSDVVLEVRVW